MEFVRELPDWDDDWLANEGVPPGTPYLLSPDFEYDFDLNCYFTKERLVSASKTQEASARDVASFLTFLWQCRGARSWRDATEDDHRAYLVWRRTDPRGPQVSGTTWDREVSSVNAFYWWALKARHVSAHPIPQRASRRMARHVGSDFVRLRDELRPATYSHEGGSDSVVWLPPASYRQWRDVGVRGFGADGLPLESFRGRWSARNTIYCDLMIRTGLRLSEQSVLSVFEVPRTRESGGFRRFWLPAAIAKGGSSRWVYVPCSLLAELETYASVDRRAVIDEARASGRYRLSGAWVVEDPQEPIAVQRVGGSVKRLKVAAMDASQRAQTFIDGPDEQ